MELIHARAVRHPGRWISSIVVVFLLVCFIDGLFSNQNFHWDIVGQYLFAPNILKGVLWTLILTISAMVIAIVLALLLTIMRESENRLLRYVANVWLWFFRGTPVYTQLVFWGLFAVIYPKLGIGLPFGGPELFSISTQDFYNATVAAIVGLALNESAYLAEIFRSGVNSVASGQLEASAALGLSRRYTWTRVVLPQAMRIIIPPTGNEMIGMLKTTSLVLAVPFTLELTYAANAVANRLYLPIPLLVVAATWYLAITSCLMIGQHFLEKHFGKGH
ncbi:amino acid ABC transporter permease [Pseudoclavibacter sp. CFCC 11306]|nr:amino acid ABC transporter permease [Pseudoclavibacter sp. CFCC 11306]